MKKIGKQKNNETRLIGVFAFFLVFIFEIYLNLGISCMRSLPDEMGAMTLAAKMAGYDWSYVMTHPAQYYGIGTTLLMYPFFALIKDPMILYKCLLGIAAFLHALPAYISIRMIQNYYKSVTSPYMLLTFGLLAALFTPTRATNMDNEPMLIVICWIIVYLIVALQFCTKKHKKMQYSVILALVLCFSYLSHTRALIYSLSMFAIIFIFYFFTKKMLVHFPSFILTFAIGMIVASFSIEYYQNSFYATDLTTEITNTTGATASSALSTVSLIFSGNGFRAFIDMICTNIWVIFIFSCGIVLICIFNSLKNSAHFISLKIKRDSIDETAIYFPETFCVCGLMVSLLGLAVLWLPSALNVYTEGANLSRGHFYLRYYGNYFGPCVLFFLLGEIEKHKDEEDQKSSMYMALVISIIATVYAIYNGVGVASSTYNKNLDWFYYFAPFSNSFESWPYVAQSITYFLSATLLVILIFIFIVRSNKIKIMVPILLIFFVWEYSYGVENFDIPYSSNENYYGSVNASYNLRKASKEIFSGADNFFYNNSTNGPQYIVQFFFPDYQIVTDLSLLDNEYDNLILSSTYLDYEAINECYSYVRLDENEYLYFNNNGRKEILEQDGYSVIDIGY